LDGVLDYLEAHPQMARLIQRASLEDNSFTRDLIGRLVQPLYSQGLQLLGSADDGWSVDDLPFLAAGLYHLIFGYYADASLWRSVMPDEPTSTKAIERQRRFVHRAVERLVSGETTGARR
jgi:hypothetical protein